MRKLDLVTFWKNLELRSNFDLSYHPAESRLFTVIETEISHHKSDDARMKFQVLTLANTTIVDRSRVITYATTLHTTIRVKLV